MEINDDLFDLSCELTNYTGKYTDEYLDKDIKPIEDTLYMQKCLEEIKKGIDEIKFPIDEDKFKVLLILISSAKQCVKEMN